MLIIYLQNNAFLWGVAVEVSIVSVLREVIIEVLEIPWQQMAVCAFLLVLGRYYARAWMARIFNYNSDVKNKVGG